MADDRTVLGPEPELIEYRDPSARAALEELGESTWRAALDWLYGEALRRPMHANTYPEAREAFFGPTGRPAPAPVSPSAWDDVLGEFRTRVAPATYNAQHPGSFSYFTPPPLPSSIAGEVLAQWIHQGVDVWHAGPIGTFVEEEVAAWLRELVGIGDDGWGVLTSGGVMANIMAMTVARDVWLPTIRGTVGTPRGGALDGARVYVSDQAHFSISRALGVLGFPDETLRVLPCDDRFRLEAAPVAEAIEADRAAGLTPLAIAAVAGSTNTGSVDDVPALADARRARERLAARRRGLRRRRAPVDPRRPPRARSGARRQRHRRSPQVVLPGLRHRRVGRAPARGPPPHVPQVARVLPVGAAGGRAARLVPVLPRGHAPVPGAEALDELEAAGHRRPRRARGAHRRPGRVLRPPVRGRARPGGHAGRARALGGVLPPPPGRIRPLAARGPRPLRGDLAARARGQRGGLGERDDASRPHLPAGRLRELPERGGRRRPRCSTPLRRLSEGVLEDLDLG